MLTLTPALDFALGLACLGFALASVRIGNEFLFTGYFWVAAAAIVGGFKLGGYTQVDPTHHWLAEVSRGPGMLALGLGVFAAKYGPWQAARWGAAGLAIAGAALVHLLAASRWLEPVNLLLGSTLLLALLAIAIDEARRRRFGSAGTALASLAVLLFVAFGLRLVPFPADGRLQRVDVLHVLLIAGYWLIWRTARNVAADSPMPIAPSK